MGIIAGVLAQISNSRVQTSWTARRRNPFGSQSEVLRLEWSVGFEANGVTTIAKVKN